MAKLTKPDVMHVAKLAKLALSETEIEKYAEQLSSVINHFSELSGIDTDGVEPTSQTTGLENVYRPDEAKSIQTLTQDEATSGSDNTIKGYFKVDAILTERSDK